MPLEPRFRRIAASGRPFVDRESALQAFDEELHKVGDGPHLLNITGIGGIGKSRLLKELRGRVSGTHRTAALDLQVPALRQQEAALAVLRTQLGSQGVQFDRYDIAYTALWQRLHPNLRVSRRELPLIEESEVLTEILDDGAGIPVFGTAIGLIKLLDKVASRVRRWRSLRDDETLRALDTLSNADLIDAVTYLFAEDVRAATEGGKAYVLFVDAYEALVYGHARTGRTASADVWLRDLAVQLDRGLLVVASREPLRWEVYDPDWTRVVRTFALDDLAMDARLRLLAESGVTDPGERHAIARASAGVPFYLHLAVDTREQFGDQRVTSAVSPEEILQRFLQHVDPAEVRFLELLSVARMFDFDVFRAVADAFDLPKHRMAWESLTAYSFVYPAGGERVQLHQLMTTALRQRISPEVTRDVHRVLRSVWDVRVDHASEQPGTGAEGGAIAPREAVYHALHAGDISGEQLLAYADRVVALGGRRGVDGILSDVQEFFAEPDHPEPPSDLVEAARCLEADAAILIGDSERAVALTPEPPALPETLVDARLAMAAAHARRISGATSEALDTYTAVWRTHRGAERLVAGLWAADLHMFGGRFRDALALVTDIRQACPAENAELRGDLARLLHLGYRFAFDFKEAARHLEEAARHYEAAGTVVGLANIRTNRAEQLAWTDPTAAVAAAEAAIEVQRDLGAMHELGKAYTAMAIAHMRLGELDRAAAAFELARSELDRAGYRSGRARAELYRAVLLARQGADDHVIEAARWAVDELEAAEVYPSLVIAAAWLLDLLRLSDPQVRAAASRARRTIQPFDSLDALEERVAEWMARLLGDRR